MAASVHSLISYEYFFLQLKFSIQLLDLTEQNGEQKEQRHVVQSVFDNKIL